MYALDQVRLNILYTLIKHRKYTEEPMDLLEFRIKILLNFPLLTEKLLNKILMDMANQGYIVIETRETEDFRKCVENAKNDKRVKNPKQHCRKKHPTKMTIDITDNGRIAYTHLVYCISKKEDNMGDSLTFTSQGIERSWESNFKRAKEWAGIDTTPPKQCI